MAAPATLAGINGGTTQPAMVPATTLPQSVAMVMPKVGTMTPVNLNLNNLQKVLKVVKDRNPLKQALGTANGLGKQGIKVQQMVTPPVFMHHNSTNKIVIRYIVSPAATTTATTQPAPLVAKINPVPPPTVTTAAAPTPTKTDKSSPPEVSDLSVVKAEPESVAITDMETDEVTQTEITSHTAQMPKVKSTSTCLLCDDCPDNLEALHLLQHYKSANGEAIDSAALDPSFAGLLSKAGVMLEEPPVDDLLSLLKTYFTSNANPSEKELTKISESVSIPVDVVRKWFAKINSAKNVAKYHNKATGATQPDSTARSLKTGDQVVIRSKPKNTGTMDTQTKLHDGFLPKALETAKPPFKQKEQPLLGGPIFITTPQTGRPVNVEAATQLRTLAAMAGHGVNNTTKKCTTPQLTYYVTTAANNHKEKKLDSSPDCIPEVEEQNDSDLTPLMKKRQLENRTVYPCDLCPKVFHNYSIMYRHKYEHSGKRPHECNVCKKAFKLKHHLIEHLRVHSGEKPYHCDKCERRFSHSGSYSQHMKKHHSYCLQSSDPGSGSNSVQSELGTPAAELQLDSRTTTPPSQSQLNSDERESEEEDSDAVCMDGIRVVHVDDGVCEIYEGNFEDDDDDDDSDDNNKGQEI